MITKVIGKRLESSNNQKTKLIKGWKENIDRILCHQGLLYISEIIRTKLISKHHNNPLADHFSIQKTRE